MKQFYSLFENLMYTRQLCFYLDNKLETYPRPASLVVLTMKIYDHDMNYCILHLINVNTAEMSYPMKLHYTSCDFLQRFKNYRNLRLSRERFDQLIYALGKFNSVYLKS